MVTYKSNKLSPNHSQKFVNQTYNRYWNEYARLYEDGYSSLYGLYGKAIASTFYKINKLIVTRKECRFFNADADCRCQFPTLNSLTTCFAFRNQKAEDKKSEYCNNRKIRFGKPEYSYMIADYQWFYMI